MIKRSRLRRILRSHGSQTRESGIAYRKQIIWAKISYYRLWTVGHNTRKQLSWPLVTVGFSLLSASEPLRANTGRVN